MVILKQQHEGQVERWKQKTEEHRGQLEKKQREEQEAHPIIAKLKEQVEFLEKENELVRADHESDKGKSNGSATDRKGRGNEGMMGVIWIF